MKFSEQIDNLCEDLEKLARIKNLCRALYYSNHSVYGYNDDMSYILDKRNNLASYKVEEKHNLVIFKNGVMIGAIQNIWGKWKANKFAEAIKK